MFRFPVPFPLYNVLFFTLQPASSSCCNRGTQIDTTGFVYFISATIKISRSTRRKTDADFSVESISLKTSCCFNAEKSLEAYAVRSNFHKISHYIYNNDQQSCIILQVAKSDISCSTKFFIKCQQQAYFTGRNRQRKCNKVIKWMEAHERP